MKFREGIDPEEKAFYKEMDGSKWCNDRMQWVAKRVSSVRNILSVQTLGLPLPETRG